MARLSVAVNRRMVLVASFGLRLLFGILTTKFKNAALSGGGIRQGRLPRRGELPEDHCRYSSPPVFFNFHCH